MNTRMFSAGQSGVAGGVEYRILEGRKQSRSGLPDLRIDLRSRSWVPVGMPLLFLLYDFLCENEDVLYPPPQYQGGEMLTRFLEGARQVGWEAAADALADQRQRAANRRSAA